MHNAWDNKQYAISMTQEHKETMSWCLPHEIQFLLGFKFLKDEKQHN